MIIPFILFSSIFSIFIVKEHVTCYPGMSIVLIITGDITIKMS